MIATQARKIKGDAQDYLRGMGFDAYVSDSGKPLALVQTDVAGARRIASHFKNVAYRNGTAFITFGKTNCRIAGIAA